MAGPEQPLLAQEQPLLRAEPQRPSRTRAVVAAISLFAICAVAPAARASAVAPAATEFAAAPAPAPAATQDDQFGPTCPTCVDWSDDDQWPINDEATVQPMASDTTAPADSAAGAADAD